MSIWRNAAAAAVFAAAMCAVPALAADPTGPVKVVYHLNEGNDQATAAMRNIKNHLAADPTAKIVVVTHAAGINFLLDGAADKNGNLYEPLVQDLAQGSSSASAISRCNRATSTEQGDRRGQIVPSGVAEVSKLQAKEATPTCVPSGAGERAPFRRRAAGRAPHSGGMTWAIV